MATAESVSARLFGETPSSRTVCHGAGGGTAMGARLVAYYRVSTAKQGASGLGLEGQEAAVASYVK
jgi:hypothetical protein